MDKKIILAFIIIAIVIIATILYFAMYNKNNMNEENNLEDTEFSNDKTLVVYYSAQNHTKIVAEKIASKLNADIFEIEPEEKYTEEDLDWTNSNSRVSKEHDNESLRNIKLKTTTIDKWENYDTILIGYPI